MRRACYDRTAEARRAYTREWNAANRHTTAYRLASQAKYHRRRALKAGAPGPGVSTAEWARILRRADGCYYCRSRTRKLTMDHVVPLSRGGAHAPGNVVAACTRCNYSKGGKLLIEWLIRKGVMQSARSSSRRQREQAQGILDARPRPREVDKQSTSLDGTVLTTTCSNTCPHLKPSGSRPNGSTTPSDSGQDREAGRTR